MTDDIVIPAQAAHLALPQGDGDSRLVAEPVGKTGISIRVVRQYTVPYSAVERVMPTMAPADAMKVLREMKAETEAANVGSSIEADAIRHRKADALTLALAALMTVRMGGA